MNDAKCQFYRNFVTENSDNTGKLFKASKKLLFKDKPLLFPDCCVKTKLANDLGEFFVQKIEKIHRELYSKGTNCNCSVVEIETQCLSTTTRASVTPLTMFKPLTNEEVHALVKSTAKKSCALDPMPMLLLVQCVDAILPVLARIINLSLQQGVFPEIWKGAIVHPCVKDAALDFSFNNLRPVSNLPYASKLTESAVFKSTTSARCH